MYLNVDSERYVSNKRAVTILPTFERAGPAAPLSYLCHNGPWQWASSGRPSSTQSTQTALFTGSVAPPGASQQGSISSPAGASCRRLQWAQASASH